MNDNSEKNIKHALSTFLGYPCNTGYDYSEVVKYFNYHLNNVGDPMHSSSYRASAVARIPSFL